MGGFEPFVGNSPPSNLFFFCFFFCSGDDRFNGVLAFWGKGLDD